MSRTLCWVLGLGCQEGGGGGGEMEWKEGERREGYNE